MSRPTGYHLSYEEQTQIREALLQDLTLNSVEFTERYAHKNWPIKSVRRIRSRLLNELRGRRLSPVLQPPEQFEIVEHNVRVDKNGEKVGESVKSRPETPEPYEQPAGFAIRKQTLRVGYADGEPRLKEAYYKLDATTTPDEIREAFERAFTGVPAATVPPQPDPALLAPDTMVLYPLPDLHFNMLAWGEETGHAFDIKIAAHEYTKAFATLVSASPQAEHALLVLLGDTLHTNDQTNQTPRGKHGLDSDTRYERSLDVTLGFLKCQIDVLLARHGSISIHVIKGNHDPESVSALHIGLREFYRFEPSVTVARYARTRAYVEFGCNLLAFAHGDKATPQRLAQAMPAEMPHQWAKSTVRRVYTGHRHVAQVSVFGSVVTETLPSPAPLDSYAAAHAYTPQREFHAIWFHRKLGQLGRHCVSIPYTLPTATNI